MPTFPTVRLDVRQKFDRAIHNMKKSCVRLNLPVQRLLNRLIPRETRKFFCKLQWDQFLQDSPNNILTQYRDSWYHDPLLHQLNDPFMRIIRKCRLGVSELRSHSWFHNQNRSKKCQHCSLQQEETLNHFFHVCPAYSEQRIQFLSNVNPILEELDLSPTVKSLLGFDHRLKSKRFSKSHLSLRRRLYQYTCEFLRSTGRFRFV